MNKTNDNMKRKLPVLLVAISLALGVAIQTPLHSGNKGKTLTVANVEALSKSTEMPIEIKICEGDKDVCDAVYREGTLHIFTYDE